MTDKAPAIFAALVAAQAEMAPVLKQAENPHLRSKYADLQSVMAACNGALHKHGFAVIQPVGRYEDGSYYVETILQHESGESLSCMVPLIINKHDMQGFGSAMTYARRYGLMAMAGVAPEEDDGEGAGKSNGKPPPRSKRQEPSDKPSAETIAAAKDALTGAVSLDDLKAKWDMLPKPVQTALGVAYAKDARKAQLAAGGETLEETLADSIPY